MINLGQIGAGAWGQNHIRTFSGLKDCYLKICCDTNKKTLEKLGYIYSQRLRLTDNFKDILNDKEIEGVVIATPAATHAALAIEALSCGKHVFVEKPLALNIEDGKKMVEVARKNKRILMVGHLLLYHSAVLKLKDYIQKGELGKVLYIYSTRVNLGQVREEENAPQVMGLLINFIQHAALQHKDRAFALFWETDRRMKTGLCVPRVAVPLLLVKLFQKRYL